MNLHELANIDLIKELGIDQLEKSEQKKIMEQMTEIMQQRVILRLVEEMPESDKEQFNKLLEDEKTSVETIESFLKEKFPNFDQIALEEIGKYKEEVIKLVKGENNDK